jgi:hypothetical protein
MNGSIDKSVKFGEILVAPVCAKYINDGVNSSKVFWVVTLKTRRCLDFSGHLYDIVTAQVSRCFCPIPLKSLFL